MGNGGDGYSRPELAGTGTGGPVWQTARTYGSAAPRSTTDAECRHLTAQVEAYVGRPDLDAPAARGLPWEVIHPEQRDLDGVRAYTALGACADCGRRVVSVRSWDGSSASGPTWTSPWTPLVLDGEQLAGRPSVPARELSTTEHTWKPEVFVLVGILRDVDWTDFDPASLDDLAEVAAVLAGELFPPPPIDLPPPTD